MITEEELVERHIREYESRMQHIDEMIARAGQAIPAGNEEVAKELEELNQERAKLQARLDELRKLSEEQWLKEGGPMVVWDLVALRLEKLLERISH